MFEKHKQDLKTGKVGACLIWTSSWFQSFGAITAKAPSPLSLPSYSLMFSKMDTMLRPMSCFAKGVSNKTLI